MLLGFGACGLRYLDVGGDLAFLGLDGPVLPLLFESAMPGGLDRRHERQEADHRNDQARPQ